MPHSPNPDHAVIPLIEEQAVVHKRKILAGGVRVHTVVHHDEVVVDEVMASEQVEVRRVALDRWVEAPVPVRHDGETTIITLHEEVLVVEKRLKATEEVHLVRCGTIRNEPQQVTLRREEAVVEHLQAVDAASDPT